MAKYGVKYAVVHIYGIPGTQQTHSKPTKTYDSIKAVRLAAKRARMNNGPGWIVRLYADNSAQIIGQVWNLKYYGYDGWIYEDKTDRMEKTYVLNKDGSLGRRL